MKTFLFLILLSFHSLAQVKLNKVDSKRVYFKYNLIKSDSVGRYLIDNINIYKTKKPMLGNLYPNPFSATLEMDLYLPRADSVNMILYDYDGNVIDHPIKAYVKSGFYRLKPHMHFDRSYGLIFYTIFSDTTIIKRMIVYY